MERIKQLLLQIFTWWSGQTLSMRLATWWRGELVGGLGGDHRESMDWSSSLEFLRASPMSDTEFKRLARG